MKVIVIGNNHAGTACVSNIHKYNKDIEVVTYEKSDNISFLACGIALWVGGTIKDPKGLFYATSESLNGLGIKVNMKHEVLSVDYTNKTIKVKNLVSGQEFEDKYDKLVLATGSWPNTPPIKGVDLEGVFLSKTYRHAENIIAYASRPEVKIVTIVGAGYIGVELVEAFKELGKEVLIIEGTDYLLKNYFDPEFTSIVKETFLKEGIHVHTNERVREIKGTQNIQEIVTDEGTYKTDMLVMAIGFHPNSVLYEDQLKTLDNGALIVNEYLQTSNPDVYACGDCAAVLSNVTEGSDYIALATNAVRMGILCAANIGGKNISFGGVQGSNAIKIFGLNMASTGFCEHIAKNRGYNVLSNYLEDVDRPEFMPTCTPVKVKVVYDANTRRLLGAQILSAANHTEVIHTFSLAIQKKMTVDELALTDFFFLPYYNKPVSWLTAICLTAK